MAARELSKVELCKVCSEYTDGRTSYMEMLPSYDAHAPLGEIVGGNAI